jgi:hypothetical protein
MKILFGVLLIGLQLVFFASFLRRADKRTSDFPIYYSVARLWERGENPYSLDNQCREVATLTPRGDCFPLAHPPILLPLIALAADDDFNASFWRWLALLFAALVICFFPLWLVSDNAAGSAQVLVFYPAVLSVFFANDTAVVLLGVVTWASLLVWQRGFIGREVLAGFALSLAVLKPQLVIILAVPMLFAHPRIAKAVFGFLAGGLLLTAWAYNLVGYEGFRGIIEITKVMAQGEGFGIGQQNMVNTTGFLVRAGLSPFWSWPLYLIAIVVLCVLWRKRGANINTISLSIVGAVFFAPHVHNYDVALLAFPLLFAHRLAPLLAALVMICTVPFKAGYAGAAFLTASLTLIYWKRLANERCAQDAPSMPRPLPHG